ncbi:MAG: SPOR domain-containing protein [Bacteroidaceae bacterium]|nr:SPOR domain-containing protein [Bacteroidaceae bacterium]
MIEFSRHIEILLLNNNCVIVPNLGGFITHDIPSRYVAEEHTFLPPYRKIGFNPQLTLNDGLLVQSYMQAYDTSFPEANRIVSTKVSEIFDILHQNGSMTLPGIGVLSMNVDGKLEFCPTESGLLSPHFFGLGKCEMKSLKQIEEENANASNENEKPFDDFAKRRDEANIITFRIRPQVIRNIAAACLMILMFFAMSVPVENTYVGENENASIAMNGMFSQIKESSYITSVPNSYKEVKKEVVVKEKPMVVPAQKEEVKPHQPETGKYSIVLASAITKKNAEAFVDKLKTLGYDDAYVYNNGKMNRVLYASFPTEKEAQTALSKLRDKETFKDAWVYFVK